MILGSLDTLCLSALVLILLVLAPMTILPLLSRWPQSAERRLAKSKVQSQSQEG